MFSKKNPETKTTPRNKMKTPDVYIIYFSNKDTIRKVLQRRNSHSKVIRLRNSSNPRITNSLILQN